MVILVQYMKEVMPRLNQPKDSNINFFVFPKWGDCQELKSLSIL